MRELRIPGSQHLSTPAHRSANSHEKIADLLPIALRSGYALEWRMPGLWAITLAADEPR